MDVERLTPYLRRRVMRLSLADRLTLQREIARSLERPEAFTAAGRLSELAGKMWDLTGEDVRKQTREARRVLARRVFIFVARMEGISQLTIADFLGMNHSTICYMERRMRNVLDYPRAYPEDIELYNKYTRLCTNN